MRIILLILCLGLFEPAEVSDWTTTTTETHYKLSYSATLKTSRWEGCPDPNYSWDGQRLSWERQITDEDGKKRTVKTFKKPIEIIAGFKAESKVLRANSKIERAVAKRFGSLKEFVWLDKISGGGVVVFPDVGKYIFLVRDRINPVLAGIGKGPNEDNYYEVIDGKTYIYIKSFSGVGMAAGTPSVLIAHWKMNEDTASDNAELVTNGAFTDWTLDTPDGWIVSGEVLGNGYGTGDPEVSQVGTGQSHANAGGETGGMCNLYTSDITNVAIQRNISGFMVGRKYMCSVNVDTRTSGSIGFTDSSHGQWTYFSMNSTGVHTWTFVATHTSFILNIKRGTANVDVTFDNLSIKLCAAEDSSGNDHDGLLQEDTSTAHVAGKINGAFDFDGSADYIEIGDTGSDVKSIAVWCNPDAVSGTDSLIDLNGTDYITIVTGTVTKNGFSSGTQVIYVDGVVASTVTANWHLIVLTSTVGFTADDLDIGRKGAGYFDGTIDNVTIFSIELSQVEVKFLYSYGMGRENWVPLADLFLGTNF